MSKIRIRAREYNGPSPHAVAILARNPSKVPLDNLILQNRKKDEMLAAAVERTEQATKVDLKMQWERNTTKKIISNTVQRRVRAKLQQAAISLEERRQELRQMLADEDAYYLRCAHSMKETMEEKQARMRAKAQELKSRREAERLNIVQQKLDQQWQNQCEELRCVLTRRHQDQVCLERAHQLEQRAEIERERQAEEAVYAELWERDRLAKASREEREAEQAMTRNYRQLETLQQQRQQRSIETEASRAQIGKEAEQLRRDRAELKAEIEMNSNFSRQEKDRYMRRLQKQIKVKHIQEKRDEEEELTKDLKILKEANDMNQLEEEETVRKRIARRQQEEKYREYLTVQRQLEQQREQEIEKIIEADVEQQNMKKADERRRKREARSTFLKEVLTVRSAQVDVRHKEREDEKREAAKERARINKIMEEHAVYQRAHHEAQRNKNRDYSRDLLSQMDYQTDIKERQRQLDQREYENGLSTEQAYEARLREVLERRDIQQGHPLRQMADRKGNSVIFN